MWFYRHLITGILFSLTNICWGGELVKPLTHFHSATNDNFSGVSIYSINGDWISSCISEAELDYHYKTIHSYNNYSEIISVIHYKDTSCSTKDYIEYYSNERLYNIGQEYINTTGLTVAAINFSNNDNDNLYYTVARIENNTLFFGDTLTNNSSNGRTPDNRPYHLNQEITFKRTTLYNH